LLRHPLADLEDPVHASVTTLRQRAAEMSTLMMRLAEAEEQYFQAQEEHDSTELESERVEFALTKAWLTFGAARIQLYATLAANPPAPSAKAAWSAANSAYRDVYRWADAHLDPPFRQNMQVLHLVMWGLRLRRIQADYFTPWYWRWWVDLGTAGRLVGRGLGTYWLYKRAKRG
jgi:hypothetical protein